MSYKAVGLMSGTSLDGLDMAYCEFGEYNGRWSYGILQAETVEYSGQMRERIICMENASAEELCTFDNELGHYFGRQVRDFILRNDLCPDMVCSHGQTIFHRPSSGFTTQIGSLNAICVETQITTIGDFRSFDVALGGQGAPLVPIGDLLLFPDHEDCLNIGGFANISHKENGEIRAYDICAANLVLNHLCGKIGMTFDRGGMVARQGKVSRSLLEELDSLPYYKEKSSASSLGKEWVKENVFPILQHSNLGTEDQIATYTLHIAKQIAGNIKGLCLVSGGGAYNDYLLELIRQNTEHEIQIADKKTLEYKEAMIFAFLGVLKSLGRVNVLASVTGARRSSSSGTIVCWS